MSSRFYDYILEVNSPHSFATGNSIFGATSNSFGEIISVSGANLKVKVANVSHYYTLGETVTSNSTLVNVFSTTLTYTSSGIVVDGNTYAIDGSTNTFALPTSVDFKDEIKIYADLSLVPQTAYEWPSVTLGTIGVDFNNYETLVMSLANDDVESSNTAIFPDSQTSSLDIIVSRGDITYPFFIAANSSDQISTASSIIQDIRPSNYIALKNSFEQEPLVRLYDIYYPGDWYPANANNNPTAEGLGYAWPYLFPIRYAEVFGDDLNIPDYTINHKGFSYSAKPINHGSVSISSDGSLGELTLKIDNTNYFFSSLVENAKIVGYNNTSAIISTVNNELVGNIDPRTDPTNIAFDTNVVAARGLGINVAYDYETTAALGEEWVSLSKDSRDLLGAVVEIKSMYASTLEHWPEYGIITSLSANILTVSDSSSYRVNDSLITDTGISLGAIVSILDNTVTVTASSIINSVIGDKLYIINANYDPYAYNEHKLLITKMVSYDSSAVSFTLAERNTQFTEELPRRKFYKNTCPWKYKGVECKYPQSGVGTIQNTYPIYTANGMFTVTNVATTNLALDKCSKSISACALRNNIQNFGGFPGTNDKL